MASGGLQQKKLDSVTLVELVRRSSLSAVEIVVVISDPEFYSAELIDGGNR